MLNYLKANLHLSGNATQRERQDLTVLSSVAFVITIVR